MPDPCIKCIVNPPLIAAILQGLIGANQSDEFNKSATALLTTAETAVRVYDRLRSMGLLSYQAPKGWTGCDQASVLADWLVDGVKDAPRAIATMNEWRFRIAKEIKDAVSGE